MRLIKLTFNIPRFMNNKENDNQHQQTTVHGVCWDIGNCMYSAKCRSAELHYDVRHSALSRGNSK